MTPERWRQIEQIYHSTLEREEGQRSSFLKEACAGDEELHREVESLLARKDQAESFIEAPVLEAAARAHAEGQTQSLVGRQLGAYRITSLLGAGGMGEVYLAHDTKLRREVAVKVLPKAFAHDRERLARFRREARMLAALNHPNIAAIYGLEEFDGVSCLVLELVPGETLAERLAGSRLRMEEALQICSQIAEGLEAAHEKGVIHRDLKPANVRITPEGKVKVLDFGLAKAFGGDDSGRDLSHLPTVSIGATREGHILGTPPYMSPEQVRGKPVDKRTDIWSFGCVLYEALTIRQAFVRETVSDTIAAILGSEPNWDRLPAMTPASIRLLLRRCLEKDPRRRVHDIADARIEIEDALVATPELKSQSRRIGWSMKVSLALAGVVLAALVSYLVLRPSADRLGGHRYTPFAMEAGVETQPAWSSDGKALAYVAEISGIRQILARGLDAAVPMQLTRSRTDCRRPFWSPDGTRVFYLMNDRLWSVGAAGGQPELVLEDASQASISPDGKTIAFGKGGAGGGLWLYSLTDRTTSRYPAPLEGQSMTRHVRFSPDGTHIGALWPTQKEHTFDNSFWKLPFPPGPQVRSSKVEASYFSWSPDSRHIVAVENALSGSGQHLFWVDTETGREESLTSGVNNETTVDVSLDGRRIAFTSGSSDGDLVDIPLSGAPLETLLATSRNETNPSWSHDGMQYAYVQGTGRQTEIWLRSVHGPWSRPLLSAPDGKGTTTFINPRFAPDGHRIAFEKWAAQGYTVWVTTIGGGAPVRVVPERNHQHHPAWSPDGNWIAYRANIGEERVIEKVPSGGGRPLMVTKVVSASNLVWSPTGEWLGYQDRDGVYLVSASGGRARRLLELEGPSGSIAFSRDGSKLYVVLRESTNWQLWSVAISTGERRQERPLKVPASSMVQGLALHPDGKRLTTSVVTVREDIWILEGFARPGWRWGG